MALGPRSLGDDAAGLIGRRPLPHTQNIYGWASLW